MDDDDTERDLAGGGGGGGYPCGPDGGLGWIHGCVGGPVDGPIVARFEHRDLTAARVSLPATESTVLHYRTSRKPNAACVEGEK